MASNISLNLLEEAVNAMKQTFDSHDLIVYLMKRRPQDYVQILNDHIEDQDPIKQAHSVIGRRLLDLQTIRPTQKVVSMNVRREETECQQWEKV